MDRIKCSLAYDGEALASHAIDAYHLAPALVSFANLVREADKVINRGQSDVQVLVCADFQARCVHIDFELVQSIGACLDAAQTVLEAPRVKTLKELLDWLAHIERIGLGLLAFLGIKELRKVNEASKSGSQPGSIDVKFDDGSQVTVPESVYAMSQEPKILAAAAGVMKPLERPGISEVRLGREGLDHPSVYNSEVARRILLACSGTMDEMEDEPQVIVAHLRVHQPTLNKTARKWKFLYDGQAKDVDISDTSIVAETIRRGVVGVGDTYWVRLEITEERTPSGNFINRYRVLEVLDFFPGPVQEEMDLDEPSLPAP